MGIGLGKGLIYDDNEDEKNQFKNSIKIAVIYFKFVF